MRRATALLPLSVAMMLTDPTGARAADPDEATLRVGQRVSMQCSACHTLGEGGEHLIGPNLWGVFGSKAGAKPDFVYSDALLKSGIVWSEETIGAWLVNPTTFLPGNKMAFVGLPKADERQALLVYLKWKTTSE